MFSKQTKSLLKCTGRTHSLSSSSTTAAAATQLSSFPSQYQCQFYSPNPNFRRENSFESRLKTSPLRMHEPKVSTYLQFDKSKLPLQNPEKVHEEALKKIATQEYAVAHKTVPELPNNQPLWLHTPQAFVHNLHSGEKTDLIDLDPFYFRVEPRKDVLHRAVVWQLANRRRGTKKTKSKYETAYSKKKIRPQKGSGKARLGMRGAPTLVGGGRAHPVQPKDWSQKMNKKERYLALRMALTLKFRRNELFVVDDLNVEHQKTGMTARILRNNFGVTRDATALIVDGAPQVNTLFERTSWNLHYVDTLSYKGLNIYDLLHRDKFIITRGALEKLTQERLDSGVRNNQKKVLSRVA